MWNAFTGEQRTKKPIPSRTAANARRFNGSSSGIVRARMRGGRRNRRTGCRTVKSHTAGFGRRTTWSHGVVAAAQFRYSTMSPLASNVRPEDGCVAAKAVSWLATPGNINSATMMTIVMHQADETGEQNRKNCYMNQKENLNFSEISLLM